MTNSRYQVEQFDKGCFQITDTVSKCEVATVVDCEHSNGLETNDAFNRAMTIAATLNAAAWDYRPTYHAQ